MTTYGILNIGEVGKDLLEHRVHFAVGALDFNTNTPLILPSSDGYALSSWYTDILDDWDTILFESLQRPWQIRYTKP